MTTENVVCYGCVKQLNIAAVGIQGVVNINKYFEIPGSISQVTWHMN